MPYLKEIVDIMNVNMRATTLSDKRFDKGAFYSIARLLPREEENQRVTIPSIVANNGSCTDVSFNDIYPFIIYHRVLSITYGKGEAFGDNQLIQETANMIAVVYGDRNILKLEPEQLVAAVNAGFLDQLTETDKNTYNLGISSINVAENNLNPEEVFQGELSGVTFNLQPNKILFSINYTIVNEYDKQCVDIC